MKSWLQEQKWIQCQVREGEEMQTHWKENPAWWLESWKCLTFDGEQIKQGIKKKLFAGFI